MLGWRVGVLVGLAGCGQVIGIRDLGVDTPATAVDSGTEIVTPLVDAGPTEPAFDAGVDVAPDVEACAVPDVAAGWTGTFTASIGYIGGTGTAQSTLEQDCTVISGPMSIDGCIADGKVLATIDESGNIVGSVTSGSAVATLKGSLTTFTQISGTFAFSVPLTANCYSASGTFTLYRH